ncbi:MAG: dihydrolipoamide acetyltransferase family protein [Mycobacteriales bacterium]
MSRLKQFKLPDLGEGLTEGEILQWMVQPGDTVTLNQNIVEVETAKAAVEVPSPFAGKVVELLHAAGETVDVGSPIITIDTDPDAGDLPPADTSGAAAAAPEASAGERQAVLVGYGPRTGTATRRPRKANGANGTTAAAPPPPPVQPAPTRAPVVPPPAPPAPVQEPAAAATGSVLAKPPVRKLAKDLGVDLTQVAPTGPNGTITRDDIQAFVDGGAEPAARPTGGETRIPIKGVRKHTAAAMVASAFTAPHVTEFLTVDVTRTMELLPRLRELPDFADIKVSPLLVAAKAVLLAAARYPMINSSWDEATQEIVVKHYVNLGIAAATDRGLIVPNIRNADQLSTKELATALNELTATARSGRTPPAAMTGGTITITNVGVFGVDTGTPILNPGETAILAVGAIKQRPWVVDGELAVRQVCQLALSFDHRIVDGELGSKALADIGRVLADPEVALLAWS